MSIEIRPSCDLPVELADQIFGLGGSVGFDGVAYTPEKALNSFLCRSDEQLPVVFPDIEPEEVKTVVDVCDESLFV